mgnify:CR=1 FL=1
MKEIVISILLVSLFTTYDIQQRNLVYEKWMLDKQSLLKYLKAK